MNFTGMMLVLFGLFVGLSVQDEAGKGGSRPSRPPSMLDSCIYDSFILSSPGNNPPNIIDNSGPVLHGMCHQVTGGRRVCSRIPLNACITNVKGNMIGRGGYASPILLPPGGSRAIWLPTRPAASRP